MNTIILLPQNAFRLPETSAPFLKLSQTKKEQKKWTLSSFRFCYKQGEIAHFSLNNLTERNCEDRKKVVKRACKAKDRTIPYDIQRTI